MLTDQYRFYVFCQRDISEAGPARAGVPRRAPWPPHAPARGLTGDNKPKKPKCLKGNNNNNGEERAEGRSRGLVCVSFVLHNGPGPGAGRSRGSRAAPSEHGAHSAGRAFFQDQCSGRPWSGPGPGEPRAGDRERAASQGQAGTEHRAGASNPHGLARPSTLPRSTLPTTLRTGLASGHRVPIPGGKRNSPLRLGGPLGTLLSCDSPLVSGSRILSSSEQAAMECL